tara:strand:+ start:1817 stop:2500 length:684 start_codon:yes stop_codon:yes gene_type:complete
MEKLSAQLEDFKNSTLLIHVGKCGGTNFVHKFSKFHKTKINKIHAERMGEQHIRRYSNFILLTRDPMERFISIFYSYIEENRQGLLQYYKYFNSPNHLAEALSSNKNRKYALESMTKFPHITKGIHWRVGHCIDTLLSLLKTHQLHIIRQEHYNNDFMKFYNYAAKKYNFKRKNLYLEEIEGYQSPSKFKNKKDRFLSSPAKSNLKEFFSDDYKILSKLSNETNEQI